MERGWMLQADEGIADADLRLPCPLRAPLEDWVDSWWKASGEPRIAVRLEGHATRHGRPDDQSDPPVVLYPGVSPARIASWTSAMDLPDWSSDVGHPLADLRDPLGRVAVLCVNPLVLVADVERLGRPAPEGWEDLLDPAFEGQLAMRGTGDSVCETTLLAWESRFGGAALDGFRRAVAAADHPSRMVQALRGRREGSPALAVLPLFFARILSRHEWIRLVWPIEGAVASPVCLRVEADATPASRELALHLFGESFAAVTDELGMPSCRPGSAGVPEGNTFLWPGWERMRDPRLDEQERGLQERFGAGSIPGL
jgi:ABC-type Fe3+ transport system substrate-binding protein